VTKTKLQRKKQGICSFH